MSAWQDRAALRTAVGREPHVQIMKHVQPRMAGSSFVTWAAQAATLPITWEDAFRRLEKPDTVHDRH